jgi:hypothetical protein
MYLGKLGSFLVGQWITASLVVDLAGSPLSQSWLSGGGCPKEWNRSVPGTACRILISGCALDMQAQQMVLAAPY